MESVYLVQNFFLGPLVVRFWVWLLLLLLLLHIHLAQDLVDREM